MFNLIPKRKKEDRLTQFDKDWGNIWERGLAGALFDTPARFFDNMAFPKVDISESKKEIIINAEIPGVDNKDIDVSIDGRYLSIKGEKKQEKEEKDSNYHMIERSYGSFQRTVELPADVDEENVEAKYKRGILKIKLKKVKGSETRKIEVKSA